MNDILAKKNIPKEFRKCKIIAILKPDISENDPSSYRPIALLSVCYKLLEKLLYIRIYDAIDRVVPPDQAGFRKRRSCTDQVLSLTNLIEIGFDQNLKTGVIFIDLSSAYDTVWRDGLLLKLIDIIPCIHLIELLENMLTNRLIKVYLNGKSSKTKMLNNGLPQGSVLAPLLFNLYTSDMPVT